MKSIIQKTKECYVSGKTTNLHKHHIFEGTANRKKSEKWGLYIYLAPEYHNMSNKGIHFNKDLDLKVKKEAQKKFEALYGHKKWMEEFHRNYIEEEKWNLNY